MRSAARLIAVGNQLEFAGRRHHTPRADAFNQRFVRGAITNQIGDRADAQTMRGGKRQQIGQARHRAVVVHHLAQHRRRIQTGQARQITARFGMAGSHQYATGRGDQRKHVAGLHQV